MLYIYMSLCVTVLYGHDLKGVILTYCNKYNSDLLKD